MLRKIKEKHCHCISFLLLHNKLAQTYQFKTTATYYLTISMGQVSVKYRWIICLGFHKISLGLHFH